MGQPAYFESRKVKLPNAWIVLCSLLEPRERFRARRVAFELDQAKRRGEGLKRWKILRAARVNHLSPEIDDVLSGIY
jgi:hypothetical protein